MSKLCVAGEKIVDICQKGDKLIEEEVGKVYRGKKIPKGSSTQRPLPPYLPTYLLLPIIQLGGCKAPG